ncbi:hypothetical protein RHMOL_Rhmol10G0218900 [Rhododendron molle]|uniref:Uncharacterized protein n=1 Tax=Rhododendron molle TaxID=49168 RepID=A0ACC0M6L6_RHOML|nr:hypothetical protein RHMOL_Rhmol10G0218900 [Rhododendron molle]
MEATRIFGGNAKARKLPSNPSMNTGACQGNQSNNPSQIKGTLDGMFKISTKEDVDQRITRCLYENGIQFNVVRFSLWANMVAAITVHQKGTNPAIMRMAPLVSMALSKQWKQLRRTTSAPEQHDIVQQTVLDEDFWRKSKRVLKITKPIYKMLRFSNTDKPIIGEVYEQIDMMLGSIKDILFNDLVVCDLIHERVVARWDKMNIPLHCLGYVLVPKYYTNSWLSNPALGGVKRRKPHVDSEVQKGYLEAIEKMVVDRNEAAVIRLQISDFVSNKGVFS